MNTFDDIKSIILNILSIDQAHQVIYQYQVIGDHSLRSNNRSRDRNNETIHEQLFLVIQLALKGEPELIQYIAKENRRDVVRSY